MSSRRMRIATRGSQLALWQANHVKARLTAVDPSLEVQLIVLTTSGDRILDTTLAKIGGKGLFVKEIEQALIDDAADLAVHSMKDVPPVLADGLRICAVSKGEAPNDALCARRPVTVDTLAHGAKVGTSSMRRQCQLLARRPDLQIAMLRGNVPTRIAKLDAGDYDAIVLAEAGLRRLGLGGRITEVIASDICLPAVAQGVLGLECRSDDDWAANLAMQAIHDVEAGVRIAAERSFLAAMGGSCSTPLAAHATLLGTASNATISIVGLCGLPDGTKILRHTEIGLASDAVAVGARLAEALLSRGARDILSAIG
jgi:hydroxymethylbilane synthase